MTSCGSKKFETSVQIVMIILIGNDCSALQLMMFLFMLCSFGLLHERMTLVTAQRSSTLNPNAPLFVPAAVRQVEDFSPEWWDLVTTSTWFHDYWLSQQQGEGGFFENTEDEFDFTDIADLLPDSIDTDEDTLTMESQYEQFLLSTEMERRNALAPNAFKQIPTIGLELDVKPMRERGPKSPVEIARYWEKPAKPVSPKSRAQRIQQPR